MKYILCIWLLISYFILNMWKISGFCNFYGWLPRLKGFRTDKEMSTVSCVDMNQWLIHFCLTSELCRWIDLLLTKNAFWYLDFYKLNTLLGSLLCWPFNHFIALSICFLPVDSEVLASSQRANLIIPTGSRLNRN